jgi:alpha-beta hydrolase superfamily lysophospholipase
LADPCAPSRAFLTHGLQPGNVAIEVVRAGAVLVATDYQGLGVDGPHPYAVNQIAGRNVLDSARAMGHIHQGPLGPVVLVGHSQGGGAALLAAELQPSYAPDVDLIGVAAGAPAAGFETLEEAYDGGPLFGFSVMAAAGYGTAYPDVDSLAVPDRTRALLSSAGEACVEEVLSDDEGLTEAGSGLDLILDSAAFEQRLEENEPAHRTPAAPIFLFHGTADTTIPLSVTEALVDRYCAMGADVTVGYYEGASHEGVFKAAVRDMQLFLVKLVDGEPPGRPACGVGGS